MALEDGGGVAVGLRWWWRAGVGRWCRVAVEDCNGGIGQRRWQKNIQRWHWCQHCWSQGLTITTLAPALARLAREDTCDVRDVRCQAEIGALQRQWQWCGNNNSVNKARARGQWRRTSTGKARAMQQWHHDRGDKGEEIWLGKGAHQWSTQVGQKGCNSGAVLKQGADYMYIAWNGINTNCILFSMCFACP